MLEAELSLRLRNRPEKTGVLGMAGVRNVSYKATSRENLDNRTRLTHSECWTKFSQPAILADFGLQEHVRFSLTEIQFGDVIPALTF